MQKITPFLWFDNNAEEAVDFYTSIFKNSKIGQISRYGDAGPGPKGSVMVVAFQLDGQEFHALNGGPHYAFTPAVSFFVNCETRDEVDRLWGELSRNGTVLMELDGYPFSERYGWVADRFGLSWQVNLGRRSQKITPFLMFAGEQNGKAEKAMEFYSSIFNDSRVDSIQRHGADAGDQAGTVLHAVFTLEGQEFMAIDGGFNHAFTFTPATSFFVKCSTQDEIDNLWEKLSDGGSDQQCGWLKDQFGVSWQIVPPVLVEMMQDNDPEKSKRVTEAMFTMKKLDIAALKHAFEGK
jgi:predicted 3-demethylubiquinone-9 3-methyltransferase (glyoxalase superfamily)